MVREPAKFIQALEKARLRNIPVIVLELGRTAAGAHFALSHTGAIAGDAEVYEAMFRHYGVISVRDLNELAGHCHPAEQSEAGCPRRPVGSARFRCERELIVDVASDHGVPFAKINEITTKVLQDTLDSGLQPVNPVDAWGTGKDFELVFEKCLTALMNDPDTGLGMFVADLSEELDLHAGYVDVCQAVVRSTDKPLVVMTNYSAWSHRKHAIRLSRSGIPVLDGTISSLRAVRHAFDYRDFLARKPLEPKARQDKPARRTGREFLSQRQDALMEDEGYALLNDYGIRVPPYRVVHNREEAREAARAIGFPLVAKTAMPGILHKSDVGGVILKLQEEEAAVKAYDELAARLGPRVLLCGMAQGNVEMAFGLVRDAQFGSFVMIAFGGLWIEILKDSQLAMAPVDEEAARRRIAALKMAKVLDGVRGAQPCDMDALVDTYVKLGELAADLGNYIGEMDINPVLVGPNGVVAVDSLIVPFVPHTKEAIHAQ